MKFKFSILLLSIIFTSTTFAIDTEEGKDMYEEDCTQCHDSSVFTRKDKKVDTFDALKKQVHRCVTSQGYSWFEEDEENVTAYLNDTFYKFSETTDSE
ncbi:MAG: hypothetical protein JKY19_04100 [Alcanivoracaceae bacterium]|nr:hypothetical protein [Alcanivoracaceae bacterium]